MLQLTLNDLKQQLRGLRDAQLRFWVGAAFVVLAMASIQYEEVIAPGVSRVGDAWMGAADGFRTRLNGFSL